MTLKPPAGTVYRGKVDGVPVASCAPREFEHIYNIYNIYNIYRRA